MAGGGTQRITRMPVSPAHIVTDAANLGFALFLLLLTLFFHGRILRPGDTIASCLTAVVLYGAMMLWLRSARPGPAAILIYSAAVLLMTTSFFEIVGNMQHLILPGWEDNRLIGLEEAVLGAPASVWLEPYVSHPLTEAMMFGYVAYVPLLPVTALLCLRSGGVQAAEDYLLNLTLVNIACYLGFMAFPAAGPVYGIHFSAPLGGGVFTWCADWIRSHAHYAGGSLPSPHCAAATVMAVMLFRHARRAFYIILPVILMLYMATVYGRFHYVADSVAGVLTALVVLRVSPLAGKVVEFVRGLRFGTAAVRQQPVAEPVRGDMPPNKAN
ncbi:MAG TPA: phosphatase PAP2 family protein [Bacteroidota bacterium]